MIDEHFESEQLENLLRKADMPAPSAEVKVRVTAEARKAWNKTWEELSWLVPFRRLTAAAAAAVLVVCLTNYSSDRALDKWRSGQSLAIERWPAGLETVPGMPYGPFARHLATVSRKPAAIDASVLRDYVETVRRALDESPQNGLPIFPAPAGRSSHLVPGRHIAGSYS